jgi:hypothetical protein
VVDGIVTAAAVQAAVADISDLKVGGVVRAQHYYIGTGAAPVSVDAGVYDIKVTRSGNTYTIQKQTYGNGQWQDVASFSRATTLRGAWSGGVYTVTASPQGNEISTALAAQLINGSWNGNIYTGNVAYAAGENYVSTGRAISVDASSIYTAGVTAGEAEFSLVDITLQGASESVYVPDDAYGITYYTAGNQVARYKGNGTRLGTVTRYTAGEDKTYYLRNTTALKLKHDGKKTYYVAPTGGATGYNRDWYYVDSGGTNYYTSNGSTNVTLLGSSETVYVPNSSGEYYLRGDSEVITPIGASSIKVTNNTRYKAGTRYNKTKYYEKTA